MRARFVAAVLTLHAALTLVSSDVEAQRRRRRAPSPPPAPPVVRSLPALREQIAHLAVEAGGPVGVTALHVESGERFPLASLYKVPATIQFLHRVDQGQLRVTDLIQLGASDARTGRSLISARLARERVTYSVQELLRLALVQSDNAAADVILFLAGGPPAVTARLRALGITDMSVDRSEGETTFHFYGIYAPPPAEVWSLDVFNRSIEAVPDERRRDAFDRFLADPRDTASPDAMVALFARILKRDLLQRASADRLVDLLVQTRTGSRRIRGLLPPGTPVAHRTGTCAEHGRVSACTNDAGLVTLPNGAGHLALAIFLKASPRPAPVRDATIARIARSAYEYWTMRFGKTSP